MRFLFRPVSNAEIALLLSALVGTLIYCGAARVTVRNASAATLASVTLSGKGFTRTLDALPPGASHTFWFVPDGDTSVRAAFHTPDRHVRTGEHGYYTAPPRPQRPGTLTIDEQLRPSFRSSRLPFTPGAAWYHPMTLSLALLALSAFPARHQIR